MPTSFAVGCIGLTPSIVTLFSPRLRSCALSPATGARRSFSRSSGVRPAVSATASTGSPHASARCVSSTTGSDPSEGSKDAVPCVTVVSRMPVLGDPGASGAPTSTSTTSPGTTTDDPAGVPVRMTSPGSSVKCCERSATSCGNGKSRPAVESSWRRSPFTQARSRSAAGSTCLASIRPGPMGVKPSPPFERTFDPLSFARRSYRPKSFAAVTQETWLHASSRETRRAAVPMTRAISPSNARSSVPAGRSMVLPDAATELDGFRKYDGSAGRRPRWSARDA